MYKCIKLPEHHQEELIWAIPVFCQKQTLVSNACFGGSKKTVTKLKNEIKSSTQNKP